MDFRRQHYIKMMKEKKEQQEKIRKEFVESGDADRLLEKLKEKAKPSIEVDDLPF